MRFFASTIIVLLTILQYSTIESQILRVDYDPKTAKGGHCYTDIYNIGPMEKGEVRKIENECVEARCSNADDRFVDIVGCALMGVPPGCTAKPGDVKKPFPECCIEFVCDKN